MGDLFGTILEQGLGMITQNFVGNVVEGLTGVRPNISTYSGGHFLSNSSSGISSSSVDLGGFYQDLMGGSSFGGGLNSMFSPRSRGLMELQMLGGLGRNNLGCNPLNYLSF